MCFAAFPSVKMRWIKPLMIKQNSISPPVHPPPPANSSVFFARNVVIIVVIMFLICGVIHFLVRFLMKKIRLSSNSHHQSTRFQESSDGDAAVYQRQLQQLFNLHDSGLDQSSIDALPVFVYKELVGLKFKEPLHCAVCLCEYTEQDNLRLLPVCSHAFHIQCIDTWLLTNSTCPLCRGSLFTPGFAVVNPVFDFDFDLDFDHDHDHSMEDEDEQEENLDHHGFSSSGNTHDGFSGTFKQSESVYPVRLGKFRAINGEKSEVGQTSNGNLDERRCYSMGSYEYVVANLDLQVAFCPNRGSSMRGSIGNGELRIEKDKVKVKGNTITASSIDEGRDGRKDIISNANGSKGDSFSVSKIWLWSKKDDHKLHNSSIPIWSNPLPM